MRVGVDVGGTNTDAVLIDGRQVLAGVKRPTTADVSEGIAAALAALFEDERFRPDEVEAVMIGTTHFTNAFVQAESLAKVGALRIGHPAGRGIPPFAAWTPRLRKAVEGHAAMVSGGFQFDGSAIGELDRSGVAEAARRFADLGITQIAVSSIFAQVNAAHELAAADIIRETVPGASVTLSSEVGRTGLIERENAAIMNVSLRPLAAQVADAFAEALRRSGLRAPFFVSQNDGTIMSAEHMARFPVLTFAAGPTNSLRGAHLLTGRTEALVADIGGTTTDFGMLVDGFPRQSTLHVDIGGIRTNFRMPDLLSIGLGGGSRVRRQGGRVVVGPDSVGFRLASEAMVFGGQTLTATDLAVAGGQASVGDTGRVAGLDPELIEAGLAAMHRVVAEGVDRMKTSRSELPLILVGGGAILIERPIPGASEIVRPADAGVANAVGAATGQVSGEVDRIYACGETGRDRAIADAQERAIAAAVLAGASQDSIKITELDDLPLQYLPGGARRIVCRAIGQLDSLKGTPAHG